MKKQISIFLLVNALIVLIACLADSCQKAPAIRACIAVAPSAGSIGATLTFESCTPDATAFSWNFGDGTVVSGDSVTHIYTTAGTYKGTLTVTNGSASNSANFTISIVPNSWTFLGVTYSIDSVVASQPRGTLTAIGSTGANSASLLFRFFPYPTASNSYTVINAETGNTYTPQLYVLLTRDSAGVQTMYGSTGGGPVTAGVVVGAGRVSVTLPLTEMYNLSNPADSTQISGSVAQTQ
jgi:PKD repeat protein